MKGVDMSVETDLERVARRALAIVSDMREVDPQLTFDTLAIMCGTEPCRMAQVLMCLAVWIDPEESTGTLTSRAVAAGTRAAA